MDYRKAEVMLRALGTVMEEQDIGPVDIVVCGAMALLMRGIIRRPTRDIDGLGLVEEMEGEMVLRRPVLSAELRAAIERVGNFYGEGKHWLSAAATILHDDTELPRDIVAESDSMSFGRRLTVRFCSRRHMVFLKLWGAINRGEPDIGDLVEMEVAEEEAREAASWCLEQDMDALPRIKAVLEAIGHGELAEKL
jgi:hypothetical protein